jgi:radical SAM superfamily enzyme YgiQ (UPF0313 family)
VSALVRKKSRLLIVCPLADIYSGVGNFGAPPLGPWRLAHYLRAHGQHVDVWDCNVSLALKLPAPDEHGSRDRAEVLAEAFVTGIEGDFDLTSYDFIGFSILSDTLPTTLGVIELVHKKKFRARLVAGNHEATVNLQDCIGKSQLDGVILADAEEPMLALMRGQAPHEIPGVLWRVHNPQPRREQFEEWNQLIRWGEIPYEAYWQRTSALYEWDKMSAEERLDKEYEIRTVRIHTIVACQLACTYCSVANTRRIAAGSMKPTITNLSTSALEENLLAVKRSVPGMMTIYDSSDEAWLGRGRAEEYLDVLERVKSIMDVDLPRGMRYLIQCRTNDLTEEIIDRASKVGVRHLTIGVESPVEQVRKDIKKPQREQLIRDAIRWGSERDVNMYCLFIMFLPSITLEQLYEAVENWRIYMALGATVSVEPFCMAYLGTALHDDPHYITESVGYNIPFSGGKKLKWSTLIWPSDRRVCAVLQWFRNNVDAFIEAARKKAGTRHTFKGFTGKITVDCLEAALQAYGRGEVAPWEPGADAKRSLVYQDYGDQMSGSEIAAASMQRRNTTASRFNSTHSLLDDSNTGVRGRIKDPALPHEMMEKK